MLTTDDLTEALHEVAETLIRPRFRSLDPSEVGHKDAGGVVTVADREAEAALTAYLLDRSPGCVVVGEEATAAEPGLIRALADADQAFLVDPVDGTSNFVAGSPDYAVMVTELHRGIPVRAWYHHPEYGRDIVAERGAGAYADGRRIVRPTAAPTGGGMRVVSSRRELQGRYGDLLVRATAGACGIDYPRLAAGETDAILYRHGWPWDHAGAAVLLGEVGAIVTARDGTPYDPTEEVAGGLLAAADAAVHQLVSTRVPLSPNAAERG